MNEELIRALGSLENAVHETRKVCDDTATRVRNIELARAGERGAAKAVAAVISALVSIAVAVIGWIVK